MADAILNLAYEVSRVTEEKVGLIDGVTRRTGMLALNARIEAARAGSAGNAFSVVAQEMGSLSSDITAIGRQLREAVASNISKLQLAGTQIQFELRGDRFTDLAKSAVETIDRNLYERSCDVRWWATDSAVVNALSHRSAETAAFATSRLGTILKSYTVYLDLWIADRTGRVVASGRPNRYPEAIGADVSATEWFKKGLATQSGDTFAVCDIERNGLLQNSPVASYSTAVRSGGDCGGGAIGVLGIFFDWAPQAQAIVNGIGLGHDARSSRVMILSDKNLILAASDGQGILEERYPLHCDGNVRGYYRTAGGTVAYALTPGYETYRGLGWRGCIEHNY